MHKVRIIENIKKWMSGHKKTSNKDLGKDNNKVMMIELMIEQLQFFDD